MSDKRRKTSHEIPAEGSGRFSSIAIAAVALLVASILFGGASRDHALRLAIVELFALPLFVLAADRLLKDSQWREHRFALGLLAGVVAIPLAQLVPLPPSVWTLVPGRDQSTLALDLVGLEAGWVPISLTPDATWRSALALLPPVAIFLATLTLSRKHRNWLVYLYLAAAVISVLFGAAQLMSGGERLYLWATTDAGDVTGFFANRNHLATYLLVALPMALVLGAAAMRRGHQQSARLWLATGFAGLVIVGLAAIRSRAGITLFAPVMMATLIAVWIASGRGKPRAGFILLLGATGAALTAVAVLALPPLLARFDANAGGELRFERWPLVAETAQTYLPVGSGIGSFNTVYRSVEPLYELDSTYFNQAHNEFLEIWLETGWLGIALIAAFIAWFARRSWTAWTGESSSERDLQRAASIGIGVVLLHSFVDYPARTVFISVLFAFCCGLLEGVVTNAKARQRTSKRGS